MILKNSTLRSSESRFNSRGFTLIELLVSIAIFSIVVLVMMGAVLSIINANRKAQSTISVINNLNFALESMTRTIKTGSNLTLTETSVFICDEDNHGVLYYFDEPNLRIMVEKEVGVSCNPNAAKTEMALTAPEVKIEGLSFYGFPASDGSGDAAVQPAVLMSIQGFMELANESRSEFNIQSTVAMRALIIKAQ